ncbi:hypothetical protein [Amycolatopsis sp.]|uniref:hypothetical protein n=1 Tax=Amycolatopsis sp. TaxID=37632 RepID=UPI002D80C197|nr:hypothetical protein [Amycolatopsis sp.]HET6703781.1 hypothetical protein [Amycolatopsis sp.]
MSDLIIAGSKFTGSDAEYFGTLAILVAIVLTAIGVFLFVKNRLEKARRARIQRLVQQLDGRPLVYVPYADCQLTVPDVLSSAQARGYAMTPNGSALRYEFTLGAPQTAFAGNPLLREVAAHLDGRPSYRRRIFSTSLTLVELMVLAHSRGYTVQQNQKFYEFARHQGRP